MEKKVGVVDVGTGNVGSILRMLTRVGATSQRVSNRHDCSNVNALILPGVGHFDHGMQALRHAGLFDVVKELALEQTMPILGICLGMQLLCEGSEEGSECGFGLVPAEVKKIPRFAGQKVPHMGWSDVRYVNSDALFRGGEEEDRFYFVHSFYVEPYNLDIMKGVASYGMDFCAAFRVDNIMGVQFHPEKSHKYGLAFFQRFVDWVE